MVAVNASQFSKQNENRRDQKLKINRLSESIYYNNCSFQLNNNINKTVKVFLYRKHK